ncbi:hypothetical protein ACWDOP_21610 [Nocardia sp. NPDC003693]
MGYPGYPQPQPTWSRPPQPTPSLWWIVPGIAAIVAGIICASIFGINALVQLPDKIGQFQRVETPGSGQIMLAADRDYTIHFEYAGAGERPPAEDVAVTLTDPNGELVRLQSVTSTMSYGINDVEGRAGYTFHADQGGIYRLTADYTTGVTVAVGEGTPSDAWQGMGIAAGIAGTGFVLGMAVIATVLVRRARNQTQISSQPEQWGLGRSQTATRTRDSNFAAASVNSFLTIVSGAAISAWLIVSILGASGSVAVGFGVLAAVVAGTTWVLARRLKSSNNGTVHEFDIFPVRGAQVARFPVDSAPHRVFSAALRAVEHLPTRTPDIDWKNLRCTALTGTSLTSHGSTIVVSVDNDRNGRSIINIQSGPASEQESTPIDQDRANVHHIGIAVNAIIGQRP